MRVHQAQRRIKAFQVRGVILAEEWRVAEAAGSGNRRRFGLVGAESEGGEGGCRGIRRG